MSRTLLKTGVGLALSLTGADRLVGRLTGARAMPLVLGYHRVVDSLRGESAAATPAMTVTVATFTRQLEWVGRRYRFASLDEVGAAVESGAAGARRLAAVTFDDGYADIYHHALPVLTRLGIPAAAFVISGAIDSPDLRTHDRLYLLLSRDWPRSRAVLAAHDTFRANELIEQTPFAAMRALLTTRPSGELARIMALLEEDAGPAGPAPDSLLPLSGPMVTALHRAGVTIGSHTSDHPVLTSEEPVTVLDQLRRSRTDLEQRLGAPVRHFAYPDGAYDDGVSAAVETAGYRYAYTACRHVDPARTALTIPRRFLWEQSCLDASGRFSSSVMGCLTNGVYDLAASCQREHRTSARPAAAGQVTG